MVTKLTVGDDFTLPLDVITMATAILGLRGSGKTNTAGVWAEELLKQGQQVIVIDPQNVWWGLKSSADGKQPGFPVIVFGGNHADLPLVGTEGKTLADFVVERRVPAIFSLRHLTLSAQRRFVTEFTEQLFFRKGEEQYQDPVLVIIDEAHKFVPQKVGPDMSMMVHRIQTLVTEGRASGIGVTLIDQRAATVNKDVLTQIELMVVHRTTGPQDKKALDEWIRDNADEGQAKEFKQSLAGLPLGKAWFWSVGWLDVFRQVQVRMRETFDSSRTPRPGEKRVTPKTLAEVDLAKLREELAITIEQAEANDPKKLKAEIAQLKRELAAKPIATEPTEVVKEVLPEGFSDRIMKDVVEIREYFTDIENQLSALLRGVQEKRNTFASLGANLITGVNQFAVGKPKAMAAVAGARPTLDRSIPKSTHTLQKRVTGTPNLRQHPSAGDLQLNKTQQRIIDALAWYESIGNLSPSLTQIGAVALIDPTGGHFSNTVGPLSSAGLIERGSGTVKLTEAGRAIASPIDAPSSLDEYHDVLRARIRKMKSAGGRTIDLLNAIIAAEGVQLTTEEIGKAIGIDHTGGHFSNTIGPLSTAGLITRRDGVVTPTVVLFPEGLA